VDQGLIDPWITQLHLEKWSKRRMSAELDELMVAVLAENEEQVRAVCRRLFGSADSQVTELMDTLTELGFIKICTILDKIRRAPMHQRPVLALGIPLVLADDLLGEQANRRALVAAKAIIHGYPDTVTPSAGK
jgi:hypothetical protein